MMRVPDATTDSCNGGSATPAVPGRPAGCHACRPVASHCKGRCRVLVRRAGAGESELSRAALAEVIEASWGPVHALVRRGGFRGPDADDLTQTYFTLFLEKGYIRTAASWKGCLRPFLRTTVKHFLSNQRDHDRAAKRGGHRWPVSLEELAEKGRVLPGLQHRVTPEALLERRQVEAALVRAALRLAEEHRAAGRGERFARLWACLLDERTKDTHAALAAEWGVGESAVRVALHRLRRRLAAMLREGAGRPGAPLPPQVVLPARLPVQTRGSTWSTPAISRAQVGELGL
jgi:DNA-directed RNA polymerase specialized sigma24 family protein